jgi:transposase
MPELASFSESSRKSALQRFQLLRAHLEDGRSLAAIAREPNISYRTLQHWLERYRTSGWLRSRVSRGSTAVVDASFRPRCKRQSLFQHALAHPKANIVRFESIEAKLDELRSYLYANRESVRGYAEAYRNGERISTAHVECTVNQLINWRMCKKQQMGWSRAGAQYLLNVKTAAINGRLERYSGYHSVPADIAA